MTVTLIVWIVVALIAIGVYLSWTAGRLDRLHSRIDAARAALDAQLLRRASVTQELATSGVLDPAASIVLYEAAHAARQAEEDQREVAESELSAALRAVFGEPAQVEAVKEVPGGEDAATELAAAVRRVPMARRFHNDSVRAARALRRHRTVRLFRLAGHARSRSPSRWTTPLRWPSRTAPAPEPGADRGPKRSTASPLALAVDRWHSVSSVAQYPASFIE